MREALLVKFPPRNEILFLAHRRETRFGWKQEVFMLFLYMGNERKLNSDLCRVLKFCNRMAESKVIYEKNLFFENL